MERSQQFDGWTWIDVSTNDTTEIAELAARLGLDPFLTDDLIQSGELPRTEIRNGEAFIVARTPLPNTERLSLGEIDMVVRPDLLVTVHHDDLPGVDAVWDGLRGRSDATPADAASRLLELFGRRTISLLLAFDEESERLEELAIGGNPSVPALVQPLRRDLTMLRRFLVPQRDAVRTWAATPLGSDEARRRAESALWDHTQIVEMIESARTLLGSVLETYRGTVAEGTNEIMKVLAVFSAIVLPLSLIAGIYGMNFAEMPELAAPNAYFVVLGAMAAIGLGLWTYFARRGFVGGPKILSMRRVGRLAGKGLGGLVHLAFRPAQAVMRVADPRSPRPKGD
ncbi:MAG: magnesium transporter CorA family protein [Acidimicrobiia bacterium]|nr:magnesium transporter CorA family protein [Acidimicrobiia bacterium]